MERRKWDSRTKALIVIQGLKGKSVSEICTEHRISQNQYYEWRDQFLSNASKAFETSQQSVKLTSLERENANLKRLVGELTLEVKKTEELLG